MARRRLGARTQSGKPKPTMRAQLLGQGLRQLREDNDMTTEEVGQYLQCDASTVSRFETGIYPARTPDVHALMALFGVQDATQREFFLKLSRDVVEPGWWDQYSEDLDTTLIDLAWIEARAQRISSFHQIVVPGLLQTQGYATATITAATLNPDQVTTGIELRTDRQKVLDRKPPLRYSAILDEAALRRLVGGPAVMREQLAHLVDLARKSTVDIRVVPLTAGAHASPDSSFYICEMTEPFPPVGYTDTLAGALYVEADTLAMFKNVWDRLRAAALNERESIALIEAAAKDLE